ncbi:MAG: UDP-N-acetylmuramate--L-alanine ligase [Bacteroidales bacterium]|nr:UDP-N-acetylmuramate--L-alanine ligase [Bacteroidales bacterium]
MMISKINTYYFIGIGGIGMSALARFFLLNGKRISGYDKNHSDITNTLKNEGAEIVFDESILAIPEHLLQIEKESIAIIYTPAIPLDHPQLVYFTQNNFRIFKRSEMLGEITKNNKCLAVAGTHGKTTVSTLLSHLLNQTSNSCSAFLGGISKNYKTNFLHSNKSQRMVVEADEFDRSFLTLNPSLSIITSIDADHLDIYGNKESIKESFNLFANKLYENGILIYKEGLELKLNEKIKKFTYSIKSELADFHIKDLRVIDGFYKFSLVSPEKTINNLVLGLPGRFNLENAVAASAAAIISEISESELRLGLATFKGVVRRFDFQLRNEKIVFIDDYAHHPEEIKACLNSVKELFPNKKITAVFQPHLFTRTRDFANEFSSALSIANETILLPIYPAREKPIEGINSELLLKNITCKEKQICEMTELVNILQNKNIEIIITMGAGDIDKLVKPIKEMLEKKYE